MTDTIISFSGRWGFLSNFHHAHGLADRLWGYSTVEHFFQAMKTTDPKLRAEIKAAPTPGKAKRLGRKLDLRSDWEDIKDEVMLVGLRVKFAPDRATAVMLLDTGDRLLVEGNHWHDQYWGNCNCGERPKCFGPGKNMLGKLLMQVREELS